MVDERMLSFAQQQLDITITDYNLAASGAFSTTLFCTTAEYGNVFMKVALDNEDDALVRLRNEVAVVNHVADMPFTSSVIHQSIGDERGAALFEAVDGDMITRSALGRPLAVSLGQVLRAIHDRSDEALPASFYGRNGEHLVARTRKAVKDTPYEPYENFVGDAQQTLRETQALNTLIHGDFHPPNMLLNGNVIANVVDWELGGAGDAHLDVAKAEFRFFRLFEHIYDELGIDYTDLVDAFREAYNMDAIDLQRVDAMKRLFLMREIGFVYKYDELETWKQLSKKPALDACLDVLEQDY